MVSALYQSRPTSKGGTRNFQKAGSHFGWKTVQDLYKREIDRLRNGQITCIPKLKESHVLRLMDPLKCFAIESDANELYVIGYEKRDHFAHFPNFHFKTLISLEP